MSDTEKTQDSSGDQEQEKNLPLSEGSRMMLEEMDNKTFRDLVENTKEE